MTNAPVGDIAGPEVRGQSNDAGANALAWWRRLVESAPDPGALAQLRRARSAVEALTVRTAASLARRVGGASKAAPDWRTLAAVDLSRVLAHVTKHDPHQHPMRAAGWKRFAGDRKESDAGEDRPVLAEARFKRLLQVGDGEEKITAFVRLIALLGGSVNVEQLARDFLRWNHPQIGNRVRERWAFEYYHAADAAPPDTDDRSLTTTEDDDE